MSGKGMDFFKKFANKEGSMFKDMKLKTTKNVAQTQTNLNFTSSENSQITKESPKTKDDISVKREQVEQDFKKPHEQKSEKSSFVKNNKQSELQITTKSNLLKQNSQESSQSEAKEAQSSLIISPKKQKSFESIKRKSNQTQNLEDFKVQKVVKVQKMPQEKVAVVQPVKALTIEKKKPEKPSQAKKSEETPLILPRKASTMMQNDKKKPQQQKPKKTDKEQILTEIYDSYIKISNVVLKQKEIQTLINENSLNIETLKQKINSYTLRQTEHAQRQEYQEADKLQSMIEQSQNKIDELQIELNFGQEESLKKEYEEITLLKTQNNNIKRINRKLKLIELQLQDDASNIKKEQTDHLEALRSKKETEKKKFQRIEKDIVYQSQQIMEYEKVLSEEVNSKMGPLEKEKKSLEDDKGQLQLQIRQLEKRLKEKKNQLSEKTKKLKSVNQNINEVKESFMEESVQLTDRKKKLQAIQNQRDEMQIQIINIQGNIDTQTKEMDSKVNAKMDEANELAHLGKYYEEKQVDFDNQCEARKVLFENYMNDCKELKSFELKHKAEKQEYNEMEYKKNNITAQITKIQEKRDSLKKKLPILENQQKKFAEQKNFKAANLKKNQIKQINDEITKIKEKIEMSLIQQHEYTQKLQDLMNAQRQYKQEQTQLNKNKALNQFKFYTSKKDKIEEYIQEINRLQVPNHKEKDKIVLQLQEEKERLTSLVESINQAYLSSKESEKEEDENEVIEDDVQDDEKIEDNDEEQGEVQRREREDEERDEEIIEEEENEGSSYKAVLLQEEKVDEQEEEDSGYVPIQLD